ncbi:MAG: 4Fe-4S dicluster domain-containing protein [bacterium]|nr:4Fe-4S dicluster domain-containing protein [bacterium]
MAEKSMLLDLTKCMACRGCQVACKQWNELPAEKTKFFSGPGYQNPKDLSSNTWTLVKFVEKQMVNGEIKWLFRKHQCMHCTDAACVKNCPVNAAIRTDEGFVVFNQKECIGCGTCVSVCPFNVPHLDGGIGEGKSKKCFGCMDRVSNGLEPACAKACPTGAIRFGDRKELLSLAHKVQREKKVRIYGEKELDGLHMIYLLPLGDPELYDLPSNPVAPVEEGSLWLKELFKSFSKVGLPTALVGLAIAYFKNRDNEA